MEELYKLYGNNDLLTHDKKVNQIVIWVDNLSKLEIFVLKIALKLNLDYILLLLEKKSKRNK